MPVTVVENKHSIQPSYISSHDLPPPPPRRKVSQHSSIRTRGLGQRSMSSSKSSASPVPTSPPPFKRRRSLSAEPTGVQNITRKVIRKLEELSGHPIEVEGDDNESDRSDEKDADGDEREVVSELLAEGLHGNENVSETKVVVVGPLASVPKKVDWEVPRKVLHSSIGFFTIYLYVSQGNPKTVVYVLWSALAVIAPADFLRLRFPQFERVYEKCLGFLMRESEKHTTNGVTWYILGVNFALTFYPLDVATVAILILSWADTAASTIGRLWGYLTPRLPTHIPLIPFFPNSPLRLPLAPRKSLAGFIAAFVTGSAIAAGFWGWMAPMRYSKDDISWWLDGGVNAGQSGYGFGGYLGLALISVCAGIISAVAEALGLIVSYLPQHFRIINNGSSEGLSPLFLLLGTTSATAGMLNMVTMQWGIVKCCKVLSLGSCIEMTAGVIQLFIQWSMFTLIFVLYMIYYPPHLRYQGRSEHDSRPPVGVLKPQYTQGWRTSVVCSWVAGIHFFVSAVTTILLLSTFPPTPAPSPSPSPEPIPLPSPDSPMSQSVARWATFLGVTSAMLAVVQYLPQIIHTARHKVVGALSIPMMCIQTPGAVLMVLSIALRPSTNWTSWITFAVAGSMQGVLLVLCICWKFRQHRLQIDDFGNPLPSNPLYEESVNNTPAQGQSRLPDSSLGTHPAADVDVPGLVVDGDSEAEDDGEATKKRAMKVALANALESAVGSDVRSDGVRTATEIPIDVDEAGSDERTPLLGDGRRMRRNDYGRTSPPPEQKVGWFGWGKR
ncbi:hypothetical protein AAF712_001723 [Marasmius tenuissimus]|uniref:Uncharacterized protein n=1 Tax=Marasmius tenuissimus TaxID=585030 RepID=A0ABR3ADS5_9AGAR